MRKAAVEAVTHMVQDEEDALAMDAFLGHFRARIVETGTDVEPTVCLAAHNLLHLLLQHGLVSLQQLLPVIRYVHSHSPYRPSSVPAVKSGCLRSISPVRRACFPPQVAACGHHQCPKAGGRSGAWHGGAVGGGPADCS